MIVSQYRLKGSSSYGARRLRLRRHPSPIIEAAVPSLEFLDYELLDLMAVSHPMLPSATSRGAGVKPWERWPVLKVSSELDFGGGMELIGLRDVRDYLVRWWDIAKALSLAAEFGEGIARLDPGVTKSWTRASNAWVQRPDKLVGKVSSDSDKYEIDGNLYESGSANEIIQSAFKNGTFTGWTTSGTGSNGSAVAADATDNLFAAVADGSAQSVKFTAGNPIHAADLQLQSTATASQLANSIMRASIWRQDDSGKALWYAVQRAFDSNWWRESDQTWQAAKTWNSMGVASTRARYISKQIDVGANATTLTLVVGIPNSGGVAGQINHLYHVQLEKKNYPTGLIVTETTKISRAADKFIVSNDRLARTWPEGWGTFRCKFRPWWSTSDLPAGAKLTLAYAQHDSNNYDWLYYDKAAGALKFERKANGVTYAASKGITLTGFTLYNGACRWTSDVGELDLPAYSLSVFAWQDGTSGSGAKGTDATAAALVVAGEADLEIGSKAGADNADGNIWAQEVTQQALSDAAVARY